jgi:hypothetical protein
MIKSVDSKMSVGCATRVKASGMSGTVAVCVTRESVAAHVGRTPLAAADGPGAPCQFKRLWRPAAEQDVRLQTAQLMPGEMK